VVEMPLLLISILVASHFGKASDEESKK
jgi:hypothetical protein